MFYALYAPIYYFLFVGVFWDEYLGRYTHGYFVGSLHYVMSLIFIVFLNVSVWRSSAYKNVQGSLWHWGTLARLSIIFGTCMWLRMDLQMIGEHGISCLFEINCYMDVYEG